MVPSSGIDGKQPHYMKFRTKGRGPSRKVYPVNSASVSSSVSRPKISSLHKKFVPHLKRSGLVDLKWIESYWDVVLEEPGRRAELLESAGISVEKSYDLDDWEDLPVEAKTVLAAKIVELKSKNKLEKMIDPELEKYSR